MPNYLSLLPVEKNKNDSKPGYIIKNEHWFIRS